MAITSITTDITGEIGINPRLVRIVCTDDYDTVISAGYLSSQQLSQVYALYPTDIVAISYDGGNSWFYPTFSGKIITLNPLPSPGSTTLPVVSGDFAVFDGTDGIIKDAGYSASNSAKTKVVMANGATVIGDVATFSDLNGTVQDSGTALTALQTKASIKAGTASYAGGSATFTITATGLTSSSIVTVNFVTQTNTAAVRTAISGTNQIGIVATADPGSSTLEWIALVNGAQ